MTSLLFTYINIVYLYYDDSYHSLTAYYVLGTLPIALYTWWYLFLKQLCKVGIIIPHLQSWKRIQICNLLQVSQLFKLKAIRSYKSMVSWLHPKESVWTYAKPGMDLGSILWVQDWSSSIVSHAAGAASSKQDRRALSLPLCCFCSEIVQRELNLPNDSSSSVLTHS